MDSLHNLDEVSNLSELPGTSFSIKLTESSSQEEQVDLIYFSKKDPMARTRKMAKTQLKEPGTSRTSPMIWQKESQPRKEERSGKMARKRKSMVTKEKQKQRRWDPAVVAAELARENHRAKQGRNDETDRGWMKNIKCVTNSGAKCWRLGTKALREIRFYQKSTVLLISMRVFFPSSLGDWAEH